MAIIELKGITLKYKGEAALDGVSFALGENSICGVLGRNGAGKTSLLSLIAAHRVPTSGEVRVFGKNPYENAEVMKKVAFIAFKDESANGFTASDTLSFARALRPNWDESYAQKLIKRFELPIKKGMSKLSLGQCAAVRAVIGLASRCEVTIYDEAYLGMDAAARKAFMSEILDDFCVCPRTILFSTHYINEMSGIFTDALILDKGKIALFDSCEALRQKRLQTESSTLQDLFIELTGGDIDEGLS